MHVYLLMETAYLCVHVHTNSWRLCPFVQSPQKIMFFSDEQAAGWEVGCVELRFMVTFFSVLENQEGSGHVSAA